VIEAALAASADAPFHEAAGDDDPAARRFAEARRILFALGPADPAILDGLIALLAADRPAIVREGAARILQSWGDAGAGAAPRLLELLRDPSEEVRGAAAWALRHMASQDDAVWREIRSAYGRGDDWTRQPDVVMTAFAGSPALAARLATLLPSLAGDARTALYRALAAERLVDVRQHAPVLFAHADAETRRAALGPWKARYEGQVPPEGVADLLVDADPAVRSSAARVLALHGLAAGTSARETATALLGADEDFVRIEAVETLALLAANDAKAVDALLDALGTHADDDVRQTAVDALSQSGAALTGIDAQAVVWLGRRVSDVVTNGGAPFADGAVRLLLRLEGGDAVLARVLTELLDARGWDQFVVDAVLEAGPRLSSLEPVLAARAADPERSRLLSRALVVLRHDARGLVLLAADGLAIPENATSSSNLTAAILAAARVPPDAPDAALLHLGAIHLADRLPPDQRLALVTDLLDDADADVRSSAAWHLSELEEDVPGTVPASLLHRLLDDSGGRDKQAVALALRLGSRAAEAVPQLRRLRDADLLRRGDDPDANVALSAAIALWTITRDPQDALPAFRTILSSGPGWPRRVDWREIGRLHDMPLGKEDADALSRAVAVMDESEIDYLGPLAPFFERCAAHAAPAVPILRDLLHSRDRRDFEGESDSHRRAQSVAVRLLGAIGPAAREALPDLRAWIGRTGDPGGVGREAIRRIEASAR
jgi:HEAT repeat protein